MTYNRTITITILFAFTLLTSMCNQKESAGKAEVKNMEKPSESKVTSAVVIFTVGECLTGDRKLALGDLITEKDILLTGKKSLCDLQIIEAESGIVIRVKAESEFKLEPSVASDGGDVNLALRKGSGLFKINNKLAKNQSVKVIMPTMVAGVRGTSFSAEISKKGDVGLQVIEGSVSTRAAIAEIDSLPEELKSKSQTIIAVESSLAKREQVLEAGQKVTISKAYTDKILKDTGLNTAIPQIQESIKKGDIKTATQKLDTLSGSTEETKTKIADKLSATTPIKVEQTKEKDIQAQLKEFEELIAIEKEKMQNESVRKTEISSRNKTKNESLMKRIEQITGKSAETLLLKDGSRVQGVIIQEGSTYHVLTTDGKKSFAESEVEGTEF
ncbi:hypothetical protein EHQ58_05910 [Leptospira ognonensis]|uniref:FecR protein domain-containing protein n=1 Tax=Leptospira ognonensis TaxID=2484945 RepID=A0A4R9K7F2_9LEPT|nr:FecR domain-containing protein [Leptospira ognonensis]TGL61310.1 hypothetical protein EHQ58_05910 [Leptospira ognonensis]